MIILTLIATLIPIILKVQAANVQGVNGAGNAFNAEAITSSTPSSLVKASEPLTLAASASSSVPLAIIKPMSSTPSVISSSTQDMLMISTYMAVLQTGTPHEASLNAISTIASGPTTAPTTTIMTTRTIDTTGISASPVPSLSPTCNLNVQISQLDATNPFQFYIQCCNTTLFQSQTMAANALSQFCVLGDVYQNFANGVNTVTFKSSPAFVNMSGLNNGKWMENLDVCTWSGVVCDGAGNITAL